MKRLRRALVATFAALLVMTQSAAAQPKEDPAKRRREVQQQRARVAADVDAQRASEQELERALDALNANVRAQEAAASAARQAAESAAAEATAATAAERQTAAELEQLKREVKAIAVNSYMRGPTAIPTEVDEADSALDAIRGQILLGAAVRRQTDIVDALRAKTEDLAERRRQAESAKARAATRRRDAQSKLSAVRGAQTQQEQLVNAAEARLERSLGEAASLAALDQQLAADIQRRQEALARQLAASRPPRAPSGGATTGRRPAAPGLTTVRGITVATSIADQLEGLLNAADSAGLSLSGSGYRSSEGQVAMRRSNCGSSDYDVYEKPASQCSPPTARPGESMHERGLAIDFTNNGRLISSRSDPAFQWLSGNASRFGLYNLPAEPWHWSTNGN